MTSKTASRKNDSSSSSDGAAHRALSVDIDDALARPEPALDGLIATFYENERPLQGLSGLLDWRFHGALSSYLRAGALSGKKGECAYVPVHRHGRTIHVILVGAGSASEPGARKMPDEETLEPLRKNLAALRLQRLAVSRADFGNPPDDFFSHRFKGVPLWIAN